MSRRIEKGWLVIESVEDETATYCVDIFRRDDGTFGFEHFRRDVEDRGAWTPLGYHAGARFERDEEARRAAGMAVAWAAAAWARRAPSKGGH
jgi:hypothetical protein